MSARAGKTQTGLHTKAVNPNCPVAIVDERSAAAAQRKRQSMADDSLQTRRALQLRRMAAHHSSWQGPGVVQRQFAHGGDVKAEWSKHKNYAAVENTLLAWSRDSAMHTDAAVLALLETGAPPEEGLSEAQRQEQEKLASDVTENRYWAMGLLGKLTEKEQVVIWGQLSPLNKLELFYQWALVSLLNAPIEVAAIVEKYGPKLADAEGKVFYEQLVQLSMFAKRHQYGAAFRLAEDAIFGNRTISLYPREKSEKERGEQGSARKLVHRPILDIEIVEGRLYARCYLGMYKKGSDSGHKDVQADESGNVMLQNIGLMNLGNPFKAMLWCEDYLKNKEHEGPVAPSPVVRSFLIPLADVDMMLKQENGVRALDQDRGSGQFGNSSNSNIYGDILHPLAKSLVSFFAEYKDYEAEAGKKNQKVLPMTALQQRLGLRQGDLRAMASKGIVAQHGRKNHNATFASGNESALAAYTASIAETGFSDATSGDAGAQMGKHAKNAFDLSRFPEVASASASYQGVMPEEISKSVVQWYKFRQELNKIKPGHTVKKSQPEPKGEASSSKKPPEGETELGAELGEVDIPSMLEALDDVVIIQRAWFAVMENDGGGDCLYHALEGRNIADIGAYRLGFAQDRRQMPESELQSTRNSYDMLASLSATLGNRTALGMMAGRQSVSNALYAQMLELPGVYAGPAEIDQWCRMHGRDVVVIDAAHQDVLLHRHDGANQVLLNLREHPEQIQQLRDIVASGDIVLFKSANHYERVTGLTEAFPAQ